MSQAFSAAAPERLPQDVSAEPHYRRRTSLWHRRLFGLQHRGCGQKLNLNAEGLPKWLEESRRDGTLSRTAIKPASAHRFSSSMRIEVGLPQLSYNERRFTVISSNISWEPRGEHLEDHLGTTVLVDCLLHHSHAIVVNGPSYGKCMHCS